MGIVKNANEPWGPERDLKILEVLGIMHNWPSEAPVLVCSCSISPLRLLKQMFVLFLCILTKMSNFSI